MLKCDKCEKKLTHIQANDTYAHHFYLDEKKGVGEITLCENCFLYLTQKMEELKDLLVYAMPMWCRERIMKQFMEDKL